MEPTIKLAHRPGRFGSASNSAAARLILKPYDEATVIQTARSALEEAGGKATIGFVFASADYRDSLPDFLELLQLHGHIPTLVGCSGSGVVGIDREAEGATGFSLLLLNLPETKIHVCELNESPGSPEECHQITGVKPEEVESWIALCDPFGFPVEAWLDSWAEAYPGISVIGGLCSGMGDTGENVFVVRDRTVLSPGSGLAIGFQGGVSIRPLLSQGCRPIGEPLTVTGSNGNMVLALGGKPAYTALSEAFETLDDREKDRAQGNLFAGLASSEYIEDFKQGDFLIRAILGADATSGAVALGAYPRVGQTLQWQVRDRVTADMALRETLLHERGHHPPPFASLVFACNGRGKDLFGAPNHDAHALSQIIGSHPSSGLFCNGEIGPIGGKSFVHGYTVAMALFS